MVPRPRMADPERRWTSNKDLRPDLRHCKGDFHRIFTRLLWMSPRTLMGEYASGMHPFLYTLRDGPLVGAGLLRFWRELNQLAGGASPPKAVHPGPYCPQPFAA